MDPVNPYQSPRSDVTAPTAEGFDQSSVFSPSGRFGRLSFIAWGVMLNLVAGVYQLVVEMVLGISPETLVEFGPKETAYTALILVLVIAGAVVAIIFGIRRLHDVDASGWFMLLGLVPLVNLFLGLFLLLKRGSDGANRFGPPRETPGWEKVVGYIGIALMVIGLVVTIVAFGALLTSPALIEQFGPGLVFPDGNAE